jgi:hypothetical protein
MRSYNATLEMRKLTALKDFPLQADYFDPLPEDMRRALADDIRRNGLKNPIEILPKNRAGFPANTIIRGHNRRDALIFNKEIETKVLVKYDFADADAVTIERYYLEDNVNRRQLDRLAMARTGLRLFEIEKKRSKGSMADGKNDDARDRVAKILGVSGRNLSRYFSILRGSVEVQNAFRQGKLSLIAAGQVGLLSAKERERIAQQIRAGEDPKTVVQSYLPKKNRRHTNAADPIRAFVEVLQRALEDLDERTDGCPVLPEWVPVLEQAQEAIAAVLANTPAADNTMVDEEDEPEGDEQGEDEQGEDDEQELDEAAEDDEQEVDEAAEDEEDEVDPFEANH